MEKVLITGVAGEIGYSLCERLIDEGIDVYGIDLPETRNSKRFEMIARNALFHFIPHQLSDVEWGTMDEVETIYHFAQSYPSTNRLSDLKKWITTVQKNVKSLVGHASTHDAKIIALSTMEVYGYSQQRITDETKARPSSLYGTLMLTMENFLVELSKDQNVPHLILRAPKLTGVPNRLEEHCRNIDRVEQENTYKKNQTFSSGYALPIADLMEILTAAGKIDAINGIVPVPGKQDPNASYTIDSAKFAELSVHL